MLPAKRTVACLLMVMTTLFLVLSCSRQTRYLAVSGPYLGQTPPGDEPQLFAPGIISTGLIVRDLTMTPDGTEIYFGVVTGFFNHATIAYTKMANGRWTRPEVAPFATDTRYMNMEPHITPDGQHLYFLSTRPREGTDYQAGWTNQDIWAVERVDDGWSEPYNLGLPIDTDKPEFFPAVTRDGTMYFTRGGRESYIHRSRLVDGRYTTPEQLPAQINSTQNQYNAFIAPDESYLIFATPSRQDGLGRDDYFICFRSEDDTWSGPINLGEKINSPHGYEYSPYVSPDGKYFFFSAQRTKTPEEYFGEDVTYDEILSAYNNPENGNIDIYWVDAGFIERLRPTE